MDPPIYFAIKFYRLCSYYFLGVYLLHYFFLWGWTRINCFQGKKLNEKYLHLSSPSYSWCIMLGEGLNISNWNKSLIVIFVPTRACIEICPLSYYIYRGLGAAGLSVNCKNNSHQSLSPEKVQEAAFPSNNNGREIREYLPLPGTSVGTESFFCRFFYPSLSLLYVKEDQVDSQIDTPNPTIFFFSQKIRTAFSLLTGWKLGVSTGHASSVAWSTPNNIIPNTRIVGAKVQGKAFVTVSFVIDAVQSQNVSCKSLVVQLYKGGWTKRTNNSRFCVFGFIWIQPCSLVGMKWYQIRMDIYEYMSCLFWIRQICFRNPSLSIWFLIVRMLNIFIYKLCLVFEPHSNRQTFEKYPS